MDDTFKIYIHRLKDGRQEKIEETLSPAFMDIHENDLAFEAPIHIKGSASAVDDSLVLMFSISAEVTTPCAICNSKCRIKICISDFCFTKELSDIKGAVFDYREILREGILLELPYRSECNEGDCPERESLAKYFTKD